MSGLEGTIGNCSSCRGTVYIGPSGAEVHANNQPCPSTGQWAANPKLAKALGASR